MKGDLQTLGLPLVLLGSLWGAVGVVLNAFGVINERRDLMFKLLDECGLCEGRTLGPVEIYLSNLLPLSTGLCLFLLIVSYVMLSIPRYMNIEDEQYARRMRFVSRFIASLPLFAFFAFLTGGAFDVYTLITRLYTHP